MNRKCEIPDQSHVLAPEQLGLGVVMMIVKTNEGGELAAVLPANATDERVVEIFRGLVDAI